MSTRPTAPVLSTPDTHIFEASTGIVSTAQDKLTDEELISTYEIKRTVSELRAGGWRRIALQFPDSFLVHAPRVVELLQAGLKDSSAEESRELSHSQRVDNDSSDVQAQIGLEKLSVSDPEHSRKRLYILGDTSYGACCVDEIAAEHVDAAVVVHYGRACLSPTARLPVIYVFTQQDLNHKLVISAFERTYPDKDTKLILMADVTYASHLPSLTSTISSLGYTSLHTTSILHDPSSLLPNRTVPPEVLSDPERLKDYHLFHVSDPPPALLLTLSSRLSSIHIYPTSTSVPPAPLLASTTLALRRRYALLTSLTTVPIFGILVNTLSVANYTSAISRIQSLLRSAGKKSYVFVVGKVNAAKIANFAEVSGWVIVGCWESSLVEGEGFWRPVITPFELEMVLEGDEKRVWTGEWRGDFGGLLDYRSKAQAEAPAAQDDKEIYEAKEEDGKPHDANELDSEEESEPPEFDLRTGRYVARSRPMRNDAESSHQQSKAKGGASGSLIRRPKDDLAVIGNEVSPGAEFLRSKRTWRGLGSDFEIAYDESGIETGTAIEQGRSGIARGYANEDHTATI